MKKQALFALSATVALLAVGCGEEESNKECSKAQDCNYPCEYCDGGACMANPGMVNDPQCSGQTACKCSDGTACPGNNAANCSVVSSCKCNDGSACPGGQKINCSASSTCTGGTWACTNSCQVGGGQSCFAFCSSKNSSTCCEDEDNVYCYDIGTCKCGDGTSCPGGRKENCNVQPTCVCGDGATCPRNDINQCDVPVTCRCDNGSICPNGYKEDCNSSSSCTCSDGSACPGGNAANCPTTSKETTILKASLTMGNQDKVWGFLSQDNWKALIPNNNTSIIDGKNMWGHGDIIMMLCAESDPNCINPLQIRALTDEEYVKPHDKNFLQFTWGMDVTLKNLPVGKYNLMLFEDSKSSVAIGRDWQSPNPQCTQGKDWWNCRISEFDMALVSTADYNAQPQSKAWQTYSYPEPKTLPVTIQECSGSSCNEDLGTLYLSHYGDRNISEPYRPEDAYLAVATYWGVRIVDLATPDKPTVLSAPGGGYDYKLVDSDGSDLYDKNYRPCGIVDGGDGQTVWITLKYDQDSGKQLHPQIAVPFNVKTKQQIGNKHIILSHAIKGGTEYDINEGSTNICMGYVKDGNFFGLSRAYSFGNGDNASWISFASDISQVLSNTKNIESINSCLIYSSSGGDNCVPDGTGVVNRHPQYLKGVIDVAMWHDVVYTIKSATNTKGEHVVASDALGRCSGSYNLFINKSKLINNEHFSNDKGVKVSKRLEDMNAQLDGGPYNEGTCMPDFGAEYGGPSITIVEKSANEAWLFASKCTMVKAWKLTWNGSSVSETPLAIDGQTNFDISEKYGQYIQSWALSPDGKTLFGAPSGRARANFGYKQGRNDAHKVTNRMMFLVLDVSGDAPKVSTAPQYNRNVDNYEGQISNDTGEKLSTPAIDPGMELLPFSYYQYLNQFSDGLTGYIIFTPASAGMHSPMIAVGQNTLWYSQKGNKKFTWTTTPYGRSPVSALGPYRDIAAYDLDKAVMLYFPNNNTSGSERYFHPYAAGSNASKTTDRSTGFKLQPDTGESTVSMGIVYIKK